GTVSAGLLAYVAASRRAGHPVFDAGFGVAAGAALLAKGFVGPALVASLTVPFAVLDRRRRTPAETIRPAAILWPLAARALWLGRTAVSGGLPAVREAVWQQQVGRFLGFAGQEYSHHRAPVWFYLLSLPGMLFPWVATLPAALHRGIRERTRDASR